MASDRASTRAPGPAMIVRTRPGILMACAIAACSSWVYAGEEWSAEEDTDLAASIAPLAWHVVGLDTLVRARDGAPNQAFVADWTVVATADVAIPNAVQIRVHFAEWILPGDEAIDGAKVRITGLDDGAMQELGSAQMRAWSGAPAFFNGGAARVELLVRGPRELWSGALVRGAYAQVLEGGYSSRSICGDTDDRVPVADAIMARVWPIGCSSTLIQDANGCFLTAGHCGPASGSVVQFNVPLSTASGSPVSPPPADQFPIDSASVQKRSDGTGQDWSYFGALVNSTNLTPEQRQGPGAIVASAAPAIPDTPLRITGYGTTSSPISPTWNQALKTHDGPLASILDTRLRHRVDTTGGNSGSGILLNDNQAIRTLVGIHTHAGCSTSATSANTGTVIQHPGLQAALAQPLGVCASGTSVVEATVAGQIWIGQDAANNVGVVRADPPAGAFASRLSMPGTIQAMAADGSRLIAVTHDLKVFAIDPGTGAYTQIGTITNASGGAMPAVTGLAIVGETGQWYAVAQTTSELFRINPATFAGERIATIGGLGQLRLGALEADADPRLLLALDDATAGTRLIEIDLTPATPTWRLVGFLGAGALDCNAMARDGEGRLLTADVATGRLLQIDRQTGGATYLANLQGVFLSAGGMAWTPSQACIADIDQSGGVDGQDLGAFFGLYEAGSSAADLNESGGIEPDDIATFIAAFERGC